LRRKTIFEAVLSGTDALAADNTATVELPEMRELTILVAGPSDPFLEAALESAPLVNWFREATLPAEIPAGVDLVICTGSEFPNEPYPAAACLLIHPIKDGFLKFKKPDRKCGTPGSKGSCSMKHHGGFLPTARMFMPGRLVSRFFSDAGTRRRGGWCWDLIPRSRMSILERPSRSCWGI
jgi:hypothetical protein